MKTDTIHLRLERGERGEVRVSVEQWPLAAAVWGARLAVPSSLLTAARERWRALLQAGGLASPSDLEAVLRLGTLLRQVVLPDPLLKALLELWVQRRRVRVAWQVDDLTWAGLPWECAYVDPAALRALRQDAAFARRCHEVVREQGGPFFPFLPRLGQRVAFFRTLGSEVESSLNLKPLGKLRLLFARADPRRDLSPNAGAILQPLQRLGARLEVDFLDDARPEALAHRLAQEEPYHAFVFYGHGEHRGPERSDLLLDSSRGPVRLPARELAEWLTAKSAQPVGLVILLACESGIELAQLLARAGVPAVVALQSVIGEAEARDFLEALMGELYRGSDLEECLIAGRQALLRVLSRPQVDRFEWAIPVLVTRSTQTALFREQDPLAAIPFVDRERERGQLLGQLEQIRQGQGQAVLITGEVGGGKTRLAQELITHLRLRAPVLLLAGRGQELHRLTAFAALGEALRSGAVGEEAEALDALPPVWQAELVGVLPELRQRWPDVPPNPPLPLNEARLRRFEALTQFFLRLTQSPARMLVLFLDDLQWADELTLAFLDYALPRLLRRPCLVLGVYHNEEPPPKGLGALLLRHDQRLTRVELPRLPEKAIQTLVERLAPTMPQAQALAHHLYRETAGNPLFLIYVLRHCLEEGLIRVHGHQWVTHAGLLKGPRMIPKAIREVVLRRVERLSPSAQNLLRIAAVLGPSFPHRLLERLWDDETDLVEALEEVLSRQFLQERLDRADIAYEFGHHKVQEALYEAMSAVRRHQLHRRALEALEQRSQVAPPDRAMLARHAFWAGLYAKSLEHVKDAIRQAKEGDRWQEGVALATLGLRALERLTEEGQAPTESDALRFDLLAGRVELNNALGQRQEQERDLELLEAVALRLGQRERALVQQQRAEWQYRLGHFEEAFRLAQGALAGYRELDDLPGQALCLNQMGNALHDLGRYPAALEHHQRALEMRQQADDLRGQAASLNNIGRVYLSQGRYPQALDHYNRALALHERLNDQYAQAVTRNNLGGLQTYLGHYEEAQRCYQEALKLFQALGHRQGEASCLNNLGNLQQNLARFQAAQEDYERALALRRDLGDEAGIALGLSNLGWISWVLGRYEVALRHHREALQLRHRRGDRRGEGTSLNNLGLVYLSLGQGKAALKALRRALTIRREIGDRQGEGVTLYNLGQALAAQGAWDGALERLEGAARLLSSLGDRRTLGQVWLALAQCHLAAGRASAALECCRRARRRCHELKAADVELEAWSCEGRIRLRLDQGERALSCSSRALSLLRGGQVCREPQRVEFTHFQVSRALGRPDLQAAHRAAQVVRQRAGWIRDSQRRRSFLALELHRRILEAEKALPAEPEEDQE